jgi:hypothetical protein
MIYGLAGFPEASPQPDEGSDSHEWSSMTRNTLL